MAISPEQIDAFLEILRSRDVMEFECEDFHVRFAPPAYQPQVQEVEDRVEGLPTRNSMFEDRRLWNGHEPPRFQTRDK